MGISYNFSAECQQIYRMPKEVYDAYMALGEASDDTNGERLWWGKESDYQPLELTKRGLLDYARDVAARKSNEVSKARQAEAALEQAARDAAAPIVEPAPREPTPPPPPPREPPPPPPQAETIKKILRTAVDPAANEHVREAAMAHVQRLDPRLESFDNTSADESAKYFRESFQDAKQRNTTIGFSNWKSVWPSLRRSTANA
jgi:hypothetical protein